uniref:Protein sleepless n=1 Tax=Steinernema glaseri TaxID=37863 RepID=A0A1I8A5I8_9BILA
MYSTTAITFFCLLALGQALQCYHCDTKQDPECNSHFERHLKTCEPLEYGEFVGEDAKQPIGCRKIVQNVIGEISIHRECAYTGEKFDGRKITGTSGVSITLYQCSGDKCNGASALSFSLALVPVVALLWRF